MNPEGFPMSIPVKMMPEINSWPLQLLIENGVTVICT